MKTQLILISIFTFMNLSCTRNVASKGSHVVLDTKALSQSVSAMNFPVDKKICYGVQVSANDIPKERFNSCNPPLAIKQGFIQEGDSISVFVPQGPARVVEIYAYLEDVLTANCTAWTEAIDYSKVYKVGEAAPKDLFKPEETITLTASFPGIGSDLKTSLSLQTGCSNASPPACENDMAGSDFTPADSTTLSGSYCNIGTFTVESGTTVNLDSLEELSISAENIVIDGTLNADGKGYGDGLGPGGGTANGHGGSHAGPGGGGVTPSLFVSYPDAPAEFGSGGFGGTGGFGGGKIILHAENSFSGTWSGYVNANGVTPTTCGSTGGGGSGGTIIIHATDYNFIGGINAQGGAGCFGGGGGSGGRVAITASSFSSTPWPNVGQAYQSDGDSAKYGSPGSIFINDLGATSTSVEFKSAYQTDQSPSFALFNTVDAIKLGSNVKLTVSGSSDLNFPVEVAGGSISINSSDTFTHPIKMSSGEIILNGTPQINYLEMSGGTTTLHSFPLTFGDIVMTGGTITHPENDNSPTYLAKIVANNIDIGTSAKINVTSKGYTSERGPGAGVGSGKGGTHYGAGGNNVSATYGSASAPSTMGSGGYGAAGYANATYRYQGAGGGHVRLEVSGTLTVDGTIEANAYDMGCCISLSGGAGGSVYISASALAGSGSITANGGNKTSSGGGAGGGGGIVAYYYGTSTFAGTISALGGSGTPVGGDGIVTDGGAASYPGP